MKRMKKLLMLLMIVALILPSTAVNAGEYEGDCTGNFSVTKTAVTHAAPDALEKTEWLVGDTITFRIAISYISGDEVDKIVLRDLLSISGGSSQVLYDDDFRVNNIPAQFNANDVGDMIGEGETLYLYITYVAENAGGYENKVEVDGYRVRRSGTSHVNSKTAYAKFHVTMPELYVCKLPVDNIPIGGIIPFPGPPIPVPVPIPFPPCQGPCSGPQHGYYYRDVWQQGDQVTYQVEVFNPNLFDLTDVLVEDVGIGASEIIPIIPGGQSAFVYFTTSYMEIGMMPNLAKATWYYLPVGSQIPKPIVGECGTMVWIEPKPDIELSKYAVNPDDTLLDPKMVDIYDMLRYEFVIFNSGYTPLFDIILEDSTIGYSNTYPGPLLPGEKIYEYVDIFASDVLIGGHSSFVNFADVEANYPWPLFLRQPAFEELGFELNDQIFLRDMKVFDDAEERVDIMYPDISLMKNTFREDPDNPGNYIEEMYFYDDDFVYYVFTIENTGDVILNDVLLHDDMLFPPEGYEVGTLNVGEVRVIEYDAMDPALMGLKYELAEGIYYPLVNEAIVRAFKEHRDDDYKSEHECLVYDEASAEIIVAHRPTPSIMLEKVAVDFLDNPISEVMIDVPYDYKFTVTNTGNAILRHITLTDTDVGILGMDLGALMPGQSTEVNYQYAHSTPGDFTNHAVVTAWADGLTLLLKQSSQDVNYEPTPQFPVEPDPLMWPPIQVMDEDDYTVFVKNPVLDLTKETDKYNYELDENVTYTFTITNNGNVPFASVLFQDIDTTFMPYEVIIPLVDKGPLDAGESMSFTLVRSFSEEGHKLNHAYVMGFEDQVIIPVDEPVQWVPDADADAEAVVGVWFYDHPEISLSKVADDTSVRTNESVTYTFTVTNIGNVPLVDVMLVDADLGIDEQLNDLDIGESDTFTYTTSYSSAGTKVNYAEASAWFMVEDAYETRDDIEPPDHVDQQVFADDTETVQVSNPPTPTPSTYTLVLTKTGEGTVATGTFTGLSGTFIMGEFVPADGWVLDSIIGDDGADVAGPNASGDYSITMNQNREVEVVFVESTPPQALPVDLTIVVTGQGNIESQVVDFVSAGEIYTFGPLYGDPGWSFNGIGGPDSTDLIMIDPIVYSLLMDESKEIHIDFVEEEVFEEELMDEEIPEASPIPATGGIPIVAYVFGGLALSGCGVVLKKKRK